MTTTEAILSALNPAQREAVTHTEGPLLILAGPGSGKTRVIAHRIAYLIGEKGVRPRRIIAVTFTNKAAREMRDRIFALVGGDIAREMALGTFHAICARTLRTDGEQIGVPRTFAIYDDADQLAAVKQAMHDIAIDPKRFAPRALLSAISRAKAELLTPQGFADLVADYFAEIVARVYRGYQDILEENTALDFDDLLMKTVQLLREREEILQKYADRYLYIHIDEFQDTNIAQYALAKLWASRHSNICVVGDPDQSIYAWRSADIRNILNFQRDFPAAKVVLLEQNYRSTQAILDSAHHVISVNVQRLEKQLWTENGGGDPIVVHEAYDEEEEAAFVAEEIQGLLKANSLAYRDFVVMYRTNAQSRPLEEAFVRRNIPYRLVGGTRFYERREVKDLLAYLRLISNPFDAVALLRVINVPPRGIGEKTLTELTRWAKEQGIPPYSALQLIADQERDQPERAKTRAGEAASPHPFQKRSLGALLRFLAIVNELIALARTANLSDLLDAVMDRNDYRPYVLAEPDGEERWENVQQLRAVAVQYDELRPTDALAAFLEDVALVTDVDEYDEAADAVTLITLHAAKGLEFPVVFMVGMEEGLLPHLRSFDDPAQMEEERRLCYVGMTRAKRGLYLLRAFRRAFSGHNPPSRYLADLPETLTASRQREAAPTLWPSRYRHGLREAEAEAPSRTETFAAGEHVLHPKFGEGIVVSCQPSGGDQLVTIAFKGEAGIKKLLLSFAPLERIDASS